MKKMVVFRRGKLDEKKERVVNSLAQARQLDPNPNL
jgi:hypothetical protein